MLLFLCLCCLPLSFQIGLVICSQFFLMCSKYILLIHPAPDVRIGVLRLLFGLSKGLFTILLRYRGGIICEVHPVSIFPPVNVS